MRPRATPRPVQQAADAMHTAAIHLLRSLRRSDAKLGVGPAGLSALSILVFGGPKTITQLAALEQVRKATMTRIVGSLERSELVEREQGDDRRSFTIYPTARGRSLMKHGRATRVATLEQRLQGLDDNEIAVLARAARLLMRALKTEPLA